MCNKKAAGIASVITGVVLVIVGIIVGLVLPNTVQKAIEEEVCVNNQESPGYKRWEGPIEITTKVYIWNITNRDDFLNKKEKPKLKEIGPYIYSTKSKKVGVKFESGKVTSTSFDQAKFNKTLTKKECPKCNENDKVTILNSAYLVLMQRFGSAKDFSTALIPYALRIWISTLNYQNMGNQNSTYLQMGQENSSLEAAFSSSAGKTFSQIEMRGLYEALMDTSKFGPFLNPSLLKKCTDISMPYISIECGLVINLGILANNSQNVSSSVMNIIHDILCPNNGSCFNATYNNSLLVAGFVKHALPNFVMKYLEGQNYGLTTSRDQSDISLGYVMSNLKLPPSGSGIPVPGIVTSHASESQAKTTKKNTTFYTCESSMEKRFSYAAIGGETNVYPKASKERLKVHGYYTQFPGQESLKPCTTTYSKLSPSYQIFLPQLLLAIPLTYKKDARVHGIPTHKYMLGDNALKVNNVTVFTRGIFDVSRLFRGPLYVSLPGFFHADKSLHKELNLPSPQQNKHSSFLKIEPISGTAIQLKLRIQMNGVITSESLLESFQGHNVSYEKKFIPIWWTETSAGIDEETAKEFNSKVFGSLKLACSLLIAFPLIGGILVVIGIVFIVIAVKNRAHIAMA